jgi:putative lipoprotein
MSMRTPTARCARPLASWLVASALLMAAARPARGADPDPWWGSDKALHFSLSAGIAAGGYAVAAQVTDDRRWRLVGGAGVAIAAGAGKEILDRYDGGDSSWRDFTWDLIGTATGVGIAWLIDRLVTGPRPRAPVEVK